MKTPAKFFLVGFLVATALVLLTFPLESVFELSGITAAVAYTMLAVFLFWSIDQYLLTEYDLIEQIIEKRNIALAIVLLGIFMVLSAAIAKADEPIRPSSPLRQPSSPLRQPSSPLRLTEKMLRLPSSPLRQPSSPLRLTEETFRLTEETFRLTEETFRLTEETFRLTEETFRLADELGHVRIAQSYVGVREATGQNDGAEVEQFLNETGGRKGMPWCAAFVSFCLKKAGASRPKPTLSALGLKTKRAVRASQVLRGFPVRAGMLSIWRTGQTRYGHVGIVLAQMGANRFHTIEGNTSAGRGNQREGDGVYRRTRRIEPMNHFRIVAFEPVRYKKAADGLR